MSWVNAVGHDGLSQVRKIPGYHDEPLHGNRKGQRSIRLSKSYRAIYIIDKNGKTEIVEIIEVSKHDY
jgi:proteic killer suppression protein